MIALVERLFCTLRAYHRYEALTVGIGQCRTCGHQLCLWCGNDPAYNDAHHWCHVWAAYAAPRT